MANISNKPIYRGSNKRLKELAYKAEKKGFTVVRTTGSHFIFKNKETGETFAANHILNKLVGDRIEKEMGL